MQMRQVFSLLLLFVVFGCVENTKRSTETLIVPETIDIGQVRAENSPVNTSFTITNSSRVSVEIEKILSSCGCTVVDLPQKIIPPKEKIAVPVKVDLFGRKGDFNTDMLVRTASGESYQVQIVGKVIEDIWYAGQSLHFYIADQQETVTKDFSISTIDYHDVQFESNSNDPDLHISELSRSTQSGETKILFRLTAHQANQYRTSAQVELIPTNADIAKLTIPVYYHPLSGEQEQRLATSQINLGEIKQNENITIKVYGNLDFLCNVHKVQAVSKNDIMKVISHIMPPNSDFLEITMLVSGNNQGLVSGSLILYSHENNLLESDEAGIQVSGIVVVE